MKLDALDEKLIEVFPGKAVKKSLLHQIKKGTNVPSFVLEFLLAKFCASEDEDEIEAGKEAVLETLQDNYVRPDEANKAQSLVQRKGRHKFIDKINVTYVEREKRHWAEMVNFTSKRIAINEKFYRDNDRLLEGGIWAEVTLGYNQLEEDDYAFFVEDLRPIQLSRFDFDDYCEGRKKFTRDEWMDIVIRSIGLEPSQMTKRLKFHHLARLFAFTESNYNFIELGPRGNGKSYTFSEFSPYGTLISGGQTSTSVLFYNNQRRRVGIIGFWDVVAFDEVGNMRVRDPHTIQIMKDYMANGRFSRGVEVIANASLAYVGNIDESIEQLVSSSEHDLFQPLPESFDLAVLHRMYTFLPGWEVPEASSKNLTNNFAFITDYLAEAMHHLAHKVNRSNQVQNLMKLGKSVTGRDEKAVIKTVSAFIKLLHPDGKVDTDYLNEYIEYALEGRRRVKEQLHKRKGDGEFADLDFSYITDEGKEIFVSCPESSDVVMAGKVREGTEKTNTEESGEELLPQETVVEDSNPWSAGESNKLEFKSTLRISLHTDKPDPRMEMACLKTIAAFLNTNGGTLVIGMDDDANPIGVETDKFKSEDNMSIHLVNIVKERMGPLAMTCIDFQFEDCKDKRIMVVKCEKSSRPIFCKDKDMELFFVRTGPSTTKLSASETQDYIRQVWG